MCTVGGGSDLGGGLDPPRRARQGGCERPGRGLTVSCGLVGVAVALRVAIGAWVAACGPEKRRMASAAASSAICVVQTLDALALPARGVKTLSVTVRVDSEGRYWIGVRELTQAARGNCNSSTAGDALRKVRAQEDPVKLFAKERDKPTGGGRAPGVGKRRQILSNRLRRRLGHPMERICH